MGALRRAGRALSARGKEGVALGLTAYLLWGLFPLYWALLKPLGAMEILAHRVAWSFLFVVGVLAVLGRLAWLRDVARPTVARLTLGTALISFNWGLYVWAVTHGHVVETALGYFINPLVSVLLGVFVLRERLRRGQWLALGGAAVGVVALGLEAGHAPWIALGLAPSFGLYGLVKKQVRVGAVESLSFETGALLVPAVGYLAWLEATGAGAFGHGARSPTLLLAGGGVVTALPLLAFGAAAQRVPLSTLGLLQYVAPSLQFLTGALVFREPLSAGRWAGFAVVWASLAAFVAEAAWARRRGVVT